MKCKLVCLFFAVLPAWKSFCQEADADVTTMAKITILNPGFSYEMRAGKFQTVYLQGFMNISGYARYSSAFGYESQFYFDPAATAQYRYYYNAGQRMDKGKRIEMNSMNYLSALYELIFSKMPVTQEWYVEEPSRRAVNRIGFVWGMQRNYPKHFSLDLNLGLGYLMSKETVLDASGRQTTRNVGRATTLGQLNLGFWLNRKK
jgi:hypothetical protein